MADTMGPPKKKIKLSSYCGKSNKHKPDFSTLPYSALVNIFKNLDFKSISHCAILCRTFHKVSNESIIYNKATFKYNMDNKLLESYISKITCPRHLTLEYKYYDNDSETEDYTIFDEYITRFLKKSGEYLTSIHFESCRNDNILSLLSDCSSLVDVGFYRCKSYFKSLPLLTNLTKIRIVSCVIPNNIVQDTLKNNQQLKTLWLSDNSNINVNDICENMAKYNSLVEEVHFCEKRRVRAKGLKALARCCQLRVIELIGGPFQCDPEDSLEQLAAGCPRLEKLTLYGWKEVNDDNLLPVLHSCIQLKELDLRGIDITIKSCREAALSLPFLHTLDVYKCDRIKKAQIAKLQRDFQEIKITMN